MKSPLRSLLLGLALFWSPALAWAQSPLLPLPLPDAASEENDGFLLGDDAGPSADVIPWAVHVASGNVQPPDAPVLLPAEFEQQRALLVGLRELNRDAPELFAQIVAETRGRIQIIAMVSNAPEYEMARWNLKRHRVATGHVHFLETAHDTMWSRDYGPRVVRQKDGSLAMIDAAYGWGRINDDLVPDVLAQKLGLPLVPLPLEIEGGNLLSNGQGLLIATTDLLSINAERGIDETQLREVLRDFYGARQVVLLEPLSGESTGHVDMFTTFTAPNTVVVGAYDPQVDPVNAAILDENAAKLSQVRTKDGLLRVVRMPMPPHEEDNWRTYTNVIYANGLLMVPVYPDVDPIGRERAMRTFSQLLPSWKIVGLDASAVSTRGGALHCIMLNLGPLAKLPKFPKPERTIDPLLEEALQFGLDVADQDLELPKETTVLEDLEAVAKKAVSPAPTTPRVAPGTNRRQPSSRLP